MHHLGAKERNASEPATSTPRPLANAEDTARESEICPASRRRRSGSVEEDEEEEEGWRSFVFVFFRKRRKNEFRASSQSTSFPSLFSLPLFPSSLNLKPTHAPESHQISSAFQRRRSRPPEAAAASPGRRRRSPLWPRRAPWRLPSGGPSWPGAAPRAYARQWGRAGGRGSRPGSGRLVRGSLGAAKEEAEAASIEEKALVVLLLLSLRSFLLLLLLPLREACWGRRGIPFAWR